MKQMSVSEAGRKGGKARAAKLSRARRIEIARQGYHASPLRQRYFAYKAFHEAIKRGEIEYKPCEVCGVSPAQAHHDDYSKPLDVRFLCRTHHNRLPRDRMLNGKRKKRANPQSNEKITENKVEENTCA